ncbi:hypothetical protein DM860_017505 [Cuscuta australis]|uniref:Alpha-soluble NSF attachment protein n=1 Tax=Cuscuta australis TaxID=267555 RepID=A0A328DH94_9ASTE|nr:hypothetical protein DM860_017505 [Cuscuta australis]
MNDQKKRLSGWSLFSNKNEDAADLFDKAANSFKLAKSWAEAGGAYAKLAECHLKLDSKHEAANAYAEAGHNYKKIDTEGKLLKYMSSAIVNYSSEINLCLMFLYVQEIAEIYEQKQYLELANEQYALAADYFEMEGVSTTANQCKTKMAEFSAHMKEGHLLNAGICQLCLGDIVAINNALEKYQELDPTFSGTREYKLLVDLAAALDEEDVAKFTDAVKEYDSMTKLYYWLCGTDDLRFEFVVSLLGFRPSGVLSGEGRGRAGLGWEHCPLSRNGKGGVPSSFFSLATVHYFF